MIKRIIAIIKILIIVLTVVFAILYFFNDNFRIYFILFMGLSLMEMFLSNYKLNNKKMSIFCLILSVVFLIMFIFML